MLSLIAFCLVPLPFVLFKYGARIRAKSKYAAANTGLGDNADASDKKKMDGQALDGDERGSHAIKHQTLKNKEVDTAGFGDRAAENV